MASILPRRPKRRPSAWVQTLLITTSFVSVARSQDHEPNQRIVAAPIKGWNGLAAAAQRLEVEYLVTSEQGTASVVVEKAILLSDSNVLLRSRIIESTQNGEKKLAPRERVLAKNDRYGFMLERRGGEGHPFVASYVGRLHSETLTELLGNVDQVSALLFSFVEPLPRLINSKDVAIDEVTTGSAPMSLRVRGHGKLVSVVNHVHEFKEFQVICDPSRSYAITSFSARIPAMRLSGIVSFANEDRAKPVPKRYVLTHLYDGQQSPARFTFEFKKWKYHDSPLDDTLFTLRNFGLPEPVGLKGGQPTAWSSFWFIGLGLACGALSLLAMRLRKRVNARRARPEF